jgi:DNA-directed RNA polymerase sigma subunit (sigma70/sigma32)
MVNASYQVRHAIAELKQGGREMKDICTKEIASAAGVTINMARKVLMLPKTPRSLESTIGVDKNTKLSVYFLLNRILCMSMM